MTLRSSYICALMLSAIGATARAQAPTPVDATPLHCVVQAQATRLGETMPLYVPPLQPQCFGTFAEAIRTATAGAVKVSPNLRPEELTDAMLAAPGLLPLASFVIGIEYEHADFGGSSIIYNGGGTCDQFSFSVSYVGDAWNDRISSARAFSGCNHSVHYEHSDFGGASVDCFTSCSYIGDAMNDRTSSIRWFR
jgi:hypothetical protein